VNFVELTSRYIDEDVEFISKLLEAIVVRKHNMYNEKNAVNSNIIDGWAKYWFFIHDNELQESSFELNDIEDLTERDDMMRYLVDGI